MLRPLILFEPVVVGRSCFALLGEVAGENPFVIAGEFLVKAITLPVKIFQLIRRSYALVDHVPRHKATCFFRGKRNKPVSLSDAIP